MSKGLKDLSFAEDLFDKTKFLDNKYNVISQEVTRTQNVIQARERALEKLSKTIKMKDPKKNFKYLEPFAVLLKEYTKNIILSNKVYRKELGQKSEAFEHLKKYIENNRRFLHRRCMKNEKVYRKNKEMLLNLRKTQQKKAKAANEWYIKHSRLIQDKRVEEAEFNTVELKLIHAVNEEKRYSRQYENVVRQTKNYQDNYVKENKCVLKRYEEFELLVLNSVKSHFLKYIQATETHLRDQLKELEGFKKNVKKFPVESYIQKFISKNRNKSFKLEEKHKYNPYFPIYTKSPEEVKNFLESSKNLELSIDKQSTIGTFLGSVFKNKKGKRSTSSPNDHTPKHKRTQTERVIMNINKRKVKLKQQVKTKECLYFEKLIEKMVREPDSLKEEEVKNSITNLEKKEYRIGFALALNLLRNNPFIENPITFKTIAQMVSKSLILSYKEQDPSVGKMLLNMCHTFYTHDDDAQLYLLKHLSQLEIWKDMRFWEGAFYDTMSDMRQRSTYYLTDQKWRDLDERERKEVAKEHANFTYGVLTSLVFSMVEIGVDHNKVRKFIEKMCNINSLETDQTNIIKKTFEDMIKTLKK